MIKPFSTESTCPKCWADADRIQVKYDHDDYRTRLLSAWATVEQVEEARCNARPYMLRTCSRCEYSWKELPLDVKEQD